MSAAGNDVDAIVLGLGPGGEEVAQSLAAAGWSVLAVDPRLVGGECPYFGCIPSKMVLRGAEVLTEARRVPALAGADTVRPDFAPVHARIRDQATDDWTDQVAVDRLTAAGAAFVRSEGRIVGRADDGRVRVEAGGEVYATPHVVIATGTAPAIPDVPGLRELYDAGPSGGELGDGSGLVWTNREALRAAEAPESLVVIGGGPIGCELAQGFANFGTRVSVVSTGALLPREEPEASAVVREVFERDGIGVHLDATVSRVGRDGDGVRVELADGTAIAADRVLVAAGRRPNLAPLGLDAVGLDPHARSVDVDEHMRAVRDREPVTGVYAIGDIAGHGAFTHLAVWQARVLVAHLLGRVEDFGGYDALAWTTFTDPEVGHVGLTERQARDARLTVRTGTQQIASNSRGWIHGPGNDGFVKVVEDADAGVLVGGTVVAPNGGEILGLLTLAVQARVPIHTLRSMHYVFPTMHRAVLEAVLAIE